MEVDLVRRGLEELIRSIDLELTKQINGNCRKFGLNSCKEFEKFFKRRVENQEVDLA